MTNGVHGLELVNILEAPSASLKLGGAEMPILRSNSGETLYSNLVPCRQEPVLRLALEVFQPQPTVVGKALARR
jgi:hypothetical protein